VTRWWQGLDPGSLLAILALATYLTTAGGHAYSTDGTFAYEMAKSAVLDPEHQYWGRFRSAFARWGVGMPAFAQPFVLGGAALGTLSPERDDIVVDDRRLRVETWPEVRAGRSEAFPLPGTLVHGGDRVRSITVVSYLANAAVVAERSTVAEIELTGPSGTTTVPIRAGVETSEWAWDRPDVRGTIAHRRAEVTGQWVGQPRGNLYVARLPIEPPIHISAWGARGSEALGASGTWVVRAASFEVADRSGESPLDRATVGASAGNDGASAPGGGSTWHDARTGDRIWSERQSRDFWAQLGFGMANAVATALSVLMVWRVGGHLGFRDPVRLVTAAGYAFGTIAWPYAKYDFSEPLAAFAILVAADATCRAFSPPPPSRQERGESKYRDVTAVAVVVVACLVAIATKYAAVFAVAALATCGIIVARPWADPPAGRRRFLAFGVAVATPFAVGGAIAIVMLLRTTGEVPILLTSSLDRLRDDWFTLPLWTGLRGLLMSSGKGLFVHAPWLLLAPAGMALLIARSLRLRRRNVGRQGAARLVMLVAYPALTVMAYAQKLVWHGGAWGPRYLVLALPWIALACAPAVEWALAGRARRIALATLGAISVAVQLLAIAKHPEQFTAIARRHVLATLPRFGADLGGRDYWDARGGDFLRRALRDEASGTARSRSLGYLWGFPDASATIRFRETRDVQLGLYSVDWDRQSRTQTVTIADALGTRTIDLGPEMASGAWVLTTVRGAPGQPVTIRLRQTGPDTAVLSAIMFDPPSIPLGASASVAGHPPTAPQAPAYASPPTEALALNVGRKLLPVPGTGSETEAGRDARGPVATSSVAHAPSSSVAQRQQVLSEAQATSDEGASSRGSPPPLQQLAPPAEDREGGARSAVPGVHLDLETAGDWPGRYGADGRIFPAFRSFNRDEVRLPAYVEGYDLDHVGDRPNPTIHVEIAEDDLLDTAILYAPPFAPLLGNAWLVAADLMNLLAPGRPDLVDGMLMRPPWQWFGIDAPRLDHPEYGLGLDFWPTLIWTNYASHRGVIAVAAVALVAMEVVALVALARLLDVAGATPRAGARSVIALAVAFVAYDALMVLP
jgi:hypothetical protein